MQESTEVTDTFKSSLHDHTRVVLALGKHVHFAQFLQQQGVVLRTYATTASKRARKAKKRGWRIDRAAPMLFALACKAHTSMDPRAAATEQIGVAVIDQALTAGQSRLSTADKQALLGLAILGIKPRMIVLPLALRRLKHIMQTIRAARGPGWKWRTAAARCIRDRGKIAKSLTAPWAWEACGAWA